MSVELEHRKVWPEIIISIKENIIWRSQNQTSIKEILN